MRTASVVHPPRDVVVIDDDDELRDLLETLLTLDGRFEVSASAADRTSGLAAVDHVHPAAAIVDLEIGEAPDLINTIRELSPDTKIVVLSMFPDPFTLLDVVRRGADAYLDRATSWFELIPTMVTLCDAADEAAGRPEDLPFPQ